VGVGVLADELETQRGVLFTPISEALPGDALDGAYLLYPDPWPKRRHHRRRFLSGEMLTRLARVMRPGAELRFATDIDGNAGWSRRGFRSYRQLPAVSFADPGSS
jgi:tRNA G46 methylase TrmB